MSLIKLYKKEHDIIICHYIQTTTDFNGNDLEMLQMLIEPNVDEMINRDEYVEIGAHLHVTTPWASNCQSIVEKMGIKSIVRIEKTHLILKNNFDPENIDPLTETIYYEPLTSFDVIYDNKNHFYEVFDIDEENKKMNHGFDEFDLNYYKKLFAGLGRNPTNIELHDLAQSNSEHARHWFFKGKLILDGKELDKSLFQMVKDTQKYTNDRSLVAFHDNSSVFRGYDITSFYPDFETHQYKTETKKFHFTFTSETHNFPTSVHAYNGAASGASGRLRDNMCVGRGGLVHTGVAGYAVGEIDPNKTDYYKKNLNTLIKASDGISEFGNEYGEPVINGFTRIFGMDIDNQRIEYCKPILFSGGIGGINNIHVKKNEPKKDMYVVKIGGPAYRIGFGGGSASSRDHNTQNYNDDINAVQRADAEIQNRMNRLIRTCIELDIGNPIQNLNDQGAGGNCNCIQELIYPNGADIHLDKIIKGDKSMSALELWISEYQESNGLLINPKDYDILIKIGERENVPISIIGQINDNGKITVYDGNQIVMNMSLEPIVGNQMPQKTYILEKHNNKLMSLKIDYNPDILSFVKQVLALPTVGSKRFLVNKVDRSVTGLVAQQQCVGPLHTPLSNYSITSQSHFDLTGCVISIGEKPIIGLINCKKMGRMSLGEMITNMMFGKVTYMSDIRFSANWMWSLNWGKGEKYNLYKACEAMCHMSNELGIAEDRGKDSLSMSYKDYKNNKTIKSPGTLVITGYCPTNDIRVKVTPYFKHFGSHIYYISFNNKFRLGASQFAYIFNQLGDNNDCPDVDNIDQLQFTFAKIQELISKNIIISGHDVSDGGIITTLCELAFAGDMGFHIAIPSNVVGNHFLFNEELGLVLEVSNENRNIIENAFSGYVYHLGKTIDADEITITNVFTEKMTVLRMCWESPSYNMELLQRTKECVDEEYQAYGKRTINIPYQNYQQMNYKIDFPMEMRKHKVAIIREDGINGERELGYAFYRAGFEVYDLCMNDLLIDENLTFDMFQCIAFAGGFSFADIVSSGKAWSCVIKTNTRINKIFDDFKNRPNTISLSICNGCQMISHLGWIPGYKMTVNKSAKFESRCPFIRVNKTNSIMLKGMENLILPIWCAHGEGRFIVDETIDIDIPMQYVDNMGNPTELYPYNPNGSQNGVASVCSVDGKHLALLPHPERCILNWQLPYDTNNDNSYTPFVMLFINAYNWCDENNK